MFFKKETIKTDEKPEENLPQQSVQEALNSSAKMQEDVKKVLEDLQKAHTQPQEESPEKLSEKLSEKLHGKGPKGATENHPQKPQLPDVKEPEDKGPEGHAH